MKTKKRLDKEGEKVSLVGNQNFHEQFEAEATFIATDAEEGSYIWKGHIHGVVETPSDKPLRGLSPDVYEFLIAE